MTIPTNAKPIILRDYEAQALASGRLGAIVRVVKPPYFVDTHGEPVTMRPAPKGSYVYRQVGEMPYPENLFRTGDTLWGKEKYGYLSDYYCQYAADYPKGAKTYLFGQKDEFGDAIICDLPAWKSPVTMPREACRHILRVKCVEVMRLQSLLCTAMKSLGIIPAKVTGGQWQQWQYDYLKPLWNSTVKPADRPTYGYKANPWVWFVIVERRHPNDPN